MAKVDLIIFTDIWRVRGSVLSEFLVELLDTAYAGSNSVRVFSPSDCLISFPMGRYSEERIAVTGFFAIRRILKKNKFRAIYIPTPNSPVGIYARIACLSLGLEYCTNNKVTYPSYLRKWLSGVASSRREGTPMGELAANLLSIIMR